MAGAGGKEIWTFEGVRPGETTVELQYVRPWEEGVEPVVVKSFGVTVEQVDKYITDKYIIP